MEAIPASQMLVVDDDPAVRALLCNIFRAQEFECEAAESGEEALEMVEKQRFDVIICDLHMPGISGLQFLEKAKPRCPSTAFLFATGEGNVRIGVRAMKEGIYDYILKPFKVEQVIRSVQQALEKKHLEMELEKYRFHLEQMVEERTRQLGAALKHIEQTYDETLAALGEAIDLRDNSTAGHSARVTRYCLMIAQAMGFSDKQLLQLARGAYLHDIGKIGIPDHILLKPGELTESEARLMRTHVEAGHRLVSRIAFLNPASEIVLAHQEHYDGNGYPRGLAGDEIPLGGRIFAVADCFDAITSDRPYRPAASYAAARAEIESQSGKQFDPEVVSAFLSIPEATWRQAREQVEREIKVARVVLPREAKAPPAQANVAEEPDARRGPGPAGLAEAGAKKRGPRKTRGAPAG
jgi:putative nucleotidyltransferase with HDIG domain